MATWTDVGVLGPTTDLSTLIPGGGGASPGGWSISDLFGAAAANPSGVAQQLASAGIPPPTGVQAPGAVPGPHFASGIGASVVPPNPISGAQTGAGQTVRGLMAQRQLPPTLGALIAGGDFGRG